MDLNALTDTAEHCVLFLFSSNANKTEEKKRTAMCHVKEEISIQHDQ